MVVWIWVGRDRHRNCGTVCDGGLRAAMRTPLSRSSVERWVGVAVSLWPEPLTYHIALAHFALDSLGGSPHSTVRLLLPTRISTTVLSTLLLLPFSITLMMPSQQLMVAVAQTENDAHSFLFRSGTGVVATSTPTIGLLVVSGVVLALFAMIMLVFRLLNTVPDPFDSNDIVRRTSGWVNVAEVAARLALAASGVFLDARTATVILVVVTVVSLLFSLLYPSFINPRLNVFRTGMYGSLCTVACVALYVSIVPQTKATVAYVVLGTMPVVISVFCELCKLRLKRFDAKPFRQLADGPDRVLAMCDGPMDVELASRSCLTAKDRETIEFGARILQAGLKKHHQSSFLHARYALYLEYAYKRHLWATLVAHEVDDDQLEKTDKLYAKVQRQVAAAIRKVFTLQPGFEERFVIFYIDNTQEQTRYAKEAGEAHLDVLQRIQFKRDLRAAKRHHQKSNSLIRAFWRDVSLEVPLIDPWYMIQLASNIQMHVSTGEWHFRRLIMDYPNSDVVLT